MAYEELMRMRWADGSPQALLLLGDLLPDLLSTDKACDIDAIIEHLAANEIWTLLDSSGLPRVAPIRRKEQGESNRPGKIR